MRNSPKHKLEEILQTFAKYIERDEISMVSKFEKIFSYLNYAIDVFTSAYSSDISVHRDDNIQVNTHLNNLFSFFFLMNHGISILAILLFAAPKFYEFSNSFEFLVLSCQKSCTLSGVKLQFSIYCIIWRLYNFVPNIRATSYPCLCIKFFRFLWQVQFFSVILSFVTLTF